MPQAAGASPTDLLGLLKQFFAKTDIRNQFERDHPLFAMMKKVPSFAGSVYVKPVKFGTGGGSAGFRSAQSNQAPQQVAQWQVTPVSDYIVATVQGVTAAASRSEEGGFENALRSEISAKMVEAHNRWGRALYRSGSGAVGKINGDGLTTGKFTLARPADAWSIQRNFVLRAMSGDGTGTLRAGTGYVLASDFTTGQVLTASSGQGGSPATPAGWAANDFIFIDGDIQARPAGLRKWLPSGTDRPSIGTPRIFSGVDTALDPLRLAGNYLDISDQSPEEGLIDGLSQVCLAGGRPTHMFCGYPFFRTLAKSIQGRVDYAPDKIDNGAGISFDTIRVMGPKGPVQLIQDPDCEEQLVYALDMEDIELISYGEVVGILSEDGLGDWLRTSGDDAYECRIGGYGNVFVGTPGRHGVFKTGA